MNKICKEIFKAIHEGKWLSIEYKNQEEKVTRYWIGIKNIDIERRVLLVDGLHLANYTVKELSIFIDSIISASLIEGSYCSVNDKLIEDIQTNPKKYKALFSNVVNVKILNYLADCNRMDTTPYCSDYSLLEHFDEDCLITGAYKLSDEQFGAIVQEFQYKATVKKSIKTIKQLCINVLSVNTKKGLYVLAYRKLNLDVVSHELIPDANVTICKEFTIDGEKQSIRMFLDADDAGLLDDFDANREEIKDKIIENNPNMQGCVDDNPYLMAVETRITVDLFREYSAIIEMHERGELTKPLQAFFGNLIELPKNRKTYPLALINNKINIDQLLAIHNAMKYPLAYIQGPPGTGKTNTIVNTISTAFFNGKTVLFASYNNHPIDGVFRTLSTLKYRNYTIPFPIIRLGNNDKIKETIGYIKELYNQVQSITIYEATLEKKKGRKIEDTKLLSELLKKHEEILDLKERKKVIEKLLASSTDMGFVVELQSRQLHELRQKLDKIGSVSDDAARALVTDDLAEYAKYLYYTSAKFIKKLGKPRYKDLWNILNDDDEDRQVVNMNKYLADDEKFRDFLEVFPIVVTTCISAHKLGEPKQYFDMTVLDEASQCNTAISLLPILRGNNLMLVGDPQQLRPVILLDSNTNDLLRKKYSVGEEYDYIENSIYKTFLSCDAVSDEVLLRYHYRCNKKIIEFNNKKYYNNKLEIKSDDDEPTPLVYVDVKNNDTRYKNTSPEECEQIVKYVMANRDKSIGVITPFVNQKNLINEELKQAGIEDVSCGTVHAFQGDEKDVILFSLALTDKTHQKTYDWLKGNKELINVAVSRAKNKLILLSSTENLERLHTENDVDDLYELAEYVRSNGESKVTGVHTNSRALGIKPFSTETEEAFLQSLNHALGNVHLGRRQYKIGEQVAISSIFNAEPYVNDLFYTGVFDFVIMRKSDNTPVFAIELDGKEHYNDETVKRRDAKKQEFCRKRNFDLIRVPNTYARRYAYIKQILSRYFEKV
ncbi:MAG: DUF2726 domain-containing protein [Clostridiales bacterium]|nr:DUF2726 domain-containing protein [Clostridiales bacterium]